MAVSLVTGALLGAAVGELLQAIIHVTKKICTCKSFLERLKSTLEAVIPKIEEINRLDRERIDRQRSDFDQLIAELEKGKELVRKCSKVHVLNYYQKYRYSKKLLKLNETLVRLFGLNMQAEILCDTKRILVDMLDKSKPVEKGDRIGFASWCAVPELPSNPVGLDVALKELKMELFRDGVSVLGLCALGGCGKTTLAAMLCRDDEVKDRYKDNIFFLTVSSSPNLKVIVQRLFERMDQGNRLVEFQNDEDAVKQLGYLMKQKEPEPILLVLDDVWSESFLKKFVFRTKGCKILVTSRTAFQQTFDFTYSLKTLSDSDASRLFRSAFHQDGNYEMPDEDRVNKIIKGCKGLPLALNVIAHSLRGQPARKWRTTERILWKGYSIFDTHKDLLDCLATSLDFLEDNVQECFLDLGLFSEDQKIPASVLIDIWVELYELDDEDDAYVNLLELSSRNLVNLVESTRKDAGEIDGNFNELFVIQHDLLRDLAIYKSREHQNIKQRKRLMMDQREDSIPKSWREQNHRAFDAHLVSIHIGETFSSCWSEMQFPEAEVMLLNFSTANCTLPRFTEKMDKLKVLIIENHGPHHADLSGLTALGHLSQLKRIRLEKIAVPSLNEITEPLENLQKISLVMCEVHHALTNWNDKISNTFSNLSEIDIDYCDDLVELPQAICKISHLKKLSVTNCHNLSALPEQLGQLTDLEVLRLHACTGLICLTDSIRRLGKLRFLDISDCSNVERMPEGMGELCSLRRLDMRRCSRVRQLPMSAMDLRHLKDVICDEETSILWESLTFCLQDLNIRVPTDNINLNWLRI